MAKVKCLPDGEDKTLNRVIKLMEEKKKTKEPKPSPKKGEGK